jgi:hypothetical protein
VRSSSRAAVSFGSCEYTAPPRQRLAQTGRQAREWRNARPFFLATQIKPLFIDDDLGPYAHIVSELRYIRIFHRNAPLRPVEIGVDIPPLGGLGAHAMDTDGAAQGRILRRDFSLAEGTDDAIEVP